MDATFADDLTPDLDGAMFEMANLRPKTTGLPFVVFVSQKGGARRDVRVKVSDNPRARPEEMISVPIRPETVIPQGALSREHALLLRAWVEKNRDVLISYWDGDVEYTEDLIQQLRPV